MGWYSSSAIDSKTGPFAALVLRVALGVVFLAHALLKVLVLTLPGTAHFFALHGFPGWTAYAVFWVELSCGTALVLGVFARYAALVLLPVVVGALTVHWANGWYFASPDGGWEYVAFLAALLVQSGLGDGPYALVPTRPIAADDDDLRQERGG